MLGSFSRLSRVCNTIHAYGDHDCKFILSEYRISLREPFQLAYRAGRACKPSLHVGTRQAMPAGVCRSSPGTLRFRFLLN